MKSYSAPFDILPTSLFKNIIDSIVPCVLSIIYNAFTSVNVQDHVQAYFMYNVQASSCTSLFQKSRCSTITSKKQILTFLCPRTTGQVIFYRLAYKDFGITMRLTFLAFRQLLDGSP